MLLQAEVAAVLKLQWWQSSFGVNVGSNDQGQMIEFITKETWQSLNLSLVMMDSDNDRALTRLLQGHETVPVIWLAAATKQ